MAALQLAAHTWRVPAPGSPGAVLVEARPFFTEPPVMYPSVFIANALAAFALNLVRRRSQALHRTHTHAPALHLCLH